MRTWQSNLALVKVWIIIFKFIKLFTECSILQPSLAKNISWYHKIWCQKLIFKTFVTNMLFRIFYFATNFYQCCCCCFLAILIKLILSNSLGLSICQERHFFAEFMSFIFFYVAHPLQNDM